MFTFDGWVTRVTFELHWALETRLHASALDSELLNEKCEQRIRVRHAKGTPTPNFLPPERKSDQGVKILTPNV